MRLQTGYPMVKKKGVDCYIKKLREAPAETQFYTKGIGVVDGSPKQVFGVLNNETTRSAIDPSLMEIKLIDTLSESIKIIYCAFKTPVCNKKFDVVFMSETKTLVDGTYIIAHKAMEHKDVPQRKGYHRLTSTDGGFLIRPLEGNLLASKVYYLTQYCCPVGFFHSQRVKQHSVQAPLVVARTNKYITKLKLQTKLIKV